MVCPTGIGPIFEKVVGPTLETSGTLSPVPLVPLPPWWSRARSVATPPTVATSSKMANGISSGDLDLSMFVST